MQHRLDSFTLILKHLIGLVFGLTSRSRPDPDQIIAGFPALTQIFPVMIERHDKPIFQWQCFGYLAVLHFVGRMIVAVPLFLVFVQHRANQYSGRDQDDTGPPGGENAMTDLGEHLIVLPDVCAVVAHGLSPVRRRPP